MNEDGDPKYPTVLVPSGGWIVFDGKNNLPVVGQPVLVYWSFKRPLTPPDQHECPFAVAEWNGHYWHNPDFDDDDYRDPDWWMQIPPTPLEDAAPQSGLP